MPGFLVVTTTTSRVTDARKMARALVEKRVAACVQVLGPIRSTYRWQGRVRQATEWLLVAKTTRPCLARLMNAVAELHPYDTPEIVAVPICAGSRKYLAWLSAATGVKRKARRGRSEASITRHS
jgi:periplasmic divalent cation tolerance protein